NIDLGSAHHTHCGLHTYTIFSFTSTAPSEIYTLSLHDALPICECGNTKWINAMHVKNNKTISCGCYHKEKLTENHSEQYLKMRGSEEHTSELQSRFDLVCRLLLEKKKTKKYSLKYKKQ